MRGGVRVVGRGGRLPLLPEEVGDGFINGDKRSGKDAEERGVSAGGEEGQG